MRRFGLLGSSVLACGLVAGAAFGGSLSRPPALSSPHGSVQSISCAAAGECAAGGGYRQGRRHEAFVVSERNGTWGDGSAVPGIDALSSRINARVDAISCATPGECAAGGYYTDDSGYQQVFVASKTNDHWRNAIAVPGAAVLNTGGIARVSSTSCPAPRECAAGGYYTDDSGDRQAFVVSETNGTWGSAIAVPGTAATGGLAYIPAAGVTSISCAAPGECAAGGSYRKGSLHEAFVVSEKNGSWGTAIEVPGTATLNTGDAVVASISCAAVGECAAGGYYTDGYGDRQAFVVSEANAVWGTATAMPGTEPPETGGQSDVKTISCAAVGECAAGGSYTDSGGDLHGFVAGETGGTWGTAVTVQGDSTIARVESISCASPGECAAGGQYYGADDLFFHAFVVSETDGVWGDAIDVPGTVAQRWGVPDVGTVSCPEAGECAAGGYFYPGRFRQGTHGFVLSETNGSWGTAVQVPAACVVPSLVGEPIAAAKSLLTISGCRLGAIKKAYSSRRPGRIAAQTPKPGATLKPRATVALTVSKGEKP
ncbi:MAG TPA: PASTA domain-containing protein [Gaiellaceae bacterium]|jgi:hypothetical protein